MKKGKSNNLLVVILLIIIVILCLFVGLLISGKISVSVNDKLSGTVENNNSATNGNQNDGTDKVDDKSNESTKAKKTISDSKLMELYKEKVQSLVPQNTVDTQVSYAIVDINKDSIPELIIKTGTCEADYRYYFYTYNENNSYYDFDNYVVYAGSIDGGHSGLYKMNNENYLVYLYAHMGLKRYHI